MNSYIKKIKRVIPRLNITKRIFSPFYKKDPVFVFHHMPKCGGTSLLRLLDKWFIVVRDYRSDWNSKLSKKKNTNRLRSIHCLAGHWVSPEEYINKRYPEVFKNKRYKVFTFLRDPLNHSLSLYRYEIENNQTDITNLEEHFELRPNYMANILNANENNYKDIIDNYEFIGIVEEMDLSVKVLANVMSKKYRPIAWINKTKKNVNTDSDKLDKSLVEKFNEINKVDYLVYNYAKKILSSHLNTI